MSTQKELCKYIQEYYGVIPDFPFSDPIAIFRHESNRKWFAAVMLNLDKRKLGLNSDGKCDGANLKCSPVMRERHRNTPGVLPGWHMNKAHWITVILDGTVPNEVLWELVNHSVELTAPKIKKNMIKNDQF